MKKIGLLALALVLALGALGVGYAAWTDQITVEGTVNTGSVDINAVYFSGTTVYKDLTTDEMINYFWVKDAGGNVMWSSPTVEPSGDNYFKVAYAASAPAGDDMVSMTFDKLFPSEAITADVIIHCDGTVPVIVTADVESDDPILNWLWDHGYVHWSAAWVCVNPSPWDYSYCAEICGPIQMHYCDYAKLWLTIDLPQAGELCGLTWPNGEPITQEDFMGLENLSFTGYFNAIQWNESEVPGTGNPCDCFAPRG